jgi:hypothetical protein
MEAATMQHAHMQHADEQDSSLPLEKLLTTVTRLMTCYARSPDERLATSIALGFDRLADIAAEDWPLLRLAGQRFSEEWRALSCRVAVLAPDSAEENCRRITLAEGPHCKLVCCADCGTVYAHIGQFRLRLPQAAFRSVCGTFRSAEQRLRDGVLLRAAGGLAEPKQAVH